MRTSTVSLIWLINSHEIYFSHATYSTITRKIYISLQPLQWKIIRQEKSFSKFNHSHFENSYYNFSLSKTYCPKSIYAVRPRGHSRCCEMGNLLSDSTPEEFIIQNAFWNGGEGEVCKKVRAVLFFVIGYLNRLAELSYRLTWEWKESYIIWSELPSLFSKQ